MMMRRTLHLRKCHVKPVRSPWSPVRSPVSRLFLSSIEVSPFFRFPSCIFVARWPSPERSPAEPVGRSVSGEAQGRASDGGRGTALPLCSRFSTRMVKKLEWIEMAPLAVSSILRAKAPIAITIPLPRLGRRDQKGSKMIWAQMLAYVTAGVKVKETCPNLSN